VARARGLHHNGPETAATARREVVVRLDDSLADAVAKAASDEGVPADAVVGAALRRFLGSRRLAALAGIAAESTGGSGEPLGEDEAMALAIDRYPTERPTGGCLDVFAHRGRPVGAIV
jgi:hypothetical protein